MRSPKVASTLFLVLAALVAALISHVVIDVAGDFLLRHDAYDDMAHGSRAIVAVEALVLGLAIAVSALFAALDEARGLRTGLRRALRFLAPRTPFPLVTSIALMGIAFLAGMQFADAAHSGRDLDFRDILGGSIALGAGIEFIVAALAAVAVWHAARRILASHAAIVRALASFISSRSVQTAPCLTLPRYERVATHAHRAVYACGDAKRGPPLFSVV